MSTTCKNLKKLHMRKCTGFDDFCCQALSKLVQRFRKLENIDLSGTQSFSDEGALVFLNSGHNIFVNLNFTGCRNMTSLAMSVFRNKMSVLHNLEINNMLISQSSFEFLSEGCRWLRSINLSRSHEFDDVALILLGKRLPFLQRLNIATCVKITDVGIIGYFEGTEAKLQALDISSCMHCGPPTGFAISTRASELLELRMNGLAMLTTESLRAIWDHAKKLTHFEMSAELRATTVHRKSMMPHVSDKVLKESNYCSLEEVIMVGACLVTDIGLCSLILKCYNNLRVINFSYCHGVSDKSLYLLGMKAKGITTLIVSGCLHVTNSGIDAISNGCPLITTLELNGCAKVTNIGAKSIAKFKKLEVLGIRNCDYIDDSGIIAIAKGCRQLMQLEMSSLDLASPRSLTFLTHFCTRLVMLNGESCNFNFTEYGKIVNTLPLAKQFNRRIGLQPRPRPIVEFNKYVMKVKEANKKILVIQKFCKFVLKHIRWMRYHNGRRRAIHTVARVYAEFRKRKDKVRKKLKNIGRNASAKILQTWTRHMLAMLYARRKVKHLRRQRDARTMLQRVFRGHKSRKRVAYLFRRLYYYYNKIGVLIHRYWVMHAARLLHKRILKVQAVARMFPRKLDYYLVKKGIRPLQYRARNYMKRRVAVKKIIESFIIEVEKTEVAANKIRKNWRVHRFNSMMSPFILTCAIFYRIDSDEKMWASLIMQKYVRRYLAILVVDRIRSGPITRERSTIKIQSMWRRARTRNWYKSFKKKKKFINSKWRFMKRCFPRLRIGRHAKKIQRIYRLYAFICHKIYFGQLISRVYRGHRGRSKVRALKFMQQMSYGILILCRWRRHRGKRERAKIRARQHMAAWKIQQMCKKFVDGPMRKRINAKKNARLLREALEAKKQLMQIKRLRVFDKIKNNFLHIHAKNIQRNWKKYLVRKEKKRVADLMRQVAVENAKDEIIAEKRKKFLSQIPNPLGGLTKSFGKFTSRLVFGDILKSEKDSERLGNSILKYQTKSILQEGIIDIHLTIGEIEAGIFQDFQQQNKLEGKPCFEKINVDLSGQLFMQVYLWTTFGNGKKCLTTLNVDAKPPGVSLVKTKANNDQRRANSELIAWHPNVAFEVSGIRGIVRGEGGFAIREIRVATNAVEEEEFTDRGLKMAADLAKFGFANISVWFLQQQPPDDRDMHKFGVVAVQDWFNDELARHMKAFNLSEQDVIALRDAYEKFQPGMVSERIRVDDYLEFLHYPHTTIAKWVASSSTLSSPGTLTFPEYVHLACYYCLFARKDFIRFIFGCMDSGNKGFLTKVEFGELCDLLGEGASRSVKLWYLQFDKFSNRKLNTLFLDGFDNFILNNPSALWMAQSLQRSFMGHNLGEEYWDKKLSQFIQQRKDMDIQLMKA